jgi:hypothetical protein
VHPIQQKFSKFAPAEMEFPALSKTNHALSYVLVLRMHCGHPAAVIALQSAVMLACLWVEQVICSVVVLPV